MNKNYTIHFLNKKKSLKLPFYLASVNAGFPSPADDYIEKSLDLNSYLIKNPASTFFVKVEGDSMKEAGINKDDILIVDRSLEAEDKKIIIAIVNGEFTVKRIRIIKDKITLEPENPKYLPIQINEGMDFEIWGVVTYIIHKAK